MVQIRRDTVIGSFENQTHAAHALQALRVAGFEDQQVGLVAREWVGGEQPADVERQQKAGEGAVTGAVTGAGIGAILGAAGVSLVPGIGPAIAGGLLVGIVGGAAMGAAVGTFAGPFLALGLSEEEARQHAERVEQGRTAVIVRTQDRQQEARTILLDHGAYDDSMAASPL
jgi:uncharacterized membrane protein